MQDFLLKLGKSTDIWRKIANFVCFKIIRHN
jgi:hypothetical protein